MVNIDFHIHINKTTKDNQDDSDFKISNLKKLIEENELYAIAITDHNYFDEKQFNNIKNELNDIKIFPGMEISIDNQYHALLIFNNLYSDYKTKLDELSKCIEDNKDSISSDKLIEYLEKIDNNNYIFIPHWYKSKNNWSDDLLKKFKDKHVDIKCLECTNIAKQKRLLNDTNEYVPVCFGDNKLFKDEKKDDEYGYRVTTLDILRDNITFSEIRNALQNNKVKIFGDKNEFVYWHKNESNYYFCCGLNVILGKRGSGKTQTLNRIYGALNAKDENDPHITYIKQFEVCEKAKEEKFDSILINEGKGIKSKLYSDNIDKVINYISNINLDKTCEDVDRDIEILFSLAKIQQLQKYDILSSQNFPTPENKLDKFIKNIVEMQKSELIQEIVNKYQDQLSKLLEEIETKWYDIELDKKLKKIVNNCLMKIKNNISIKCNIQVMPNLSEKLVNYIKHYEVIKNSNSFFENLKTTTKSIDIGKKFKKIITMSKFKDMSKMRSCIGKNKGVTTDIFKCYEDNNICKFIQVMIKEKKLSLDLLKNALLNVDVEVKNEYDSKLSGGERSYYILSSMLNDANKGGEILLLDEIDYSFDNIFLYEDIVSKIKEMISNNITICITTHNSTIALLTDPNKIIYCDYDAKSGEYLTYSGSTNSEKFENVDSTKTSIDSFKTIINILESGEEPYECKKEKYDQFRQQ